MNIKPILFNTAMVQALLDGRKTQTRRPIKPQPTLNKLSGFNSDGWAYGIGIDHAQSTDWHKR